MKMAVKNNTDLAGNPLFPGVTINTPDTGGAGVSSDAVGGNKKYPLPYPFAHVGAITAGSTVTMVIHAEDLRYKSVPWLPLEPSREWQMLVQQGIVTITYSEGATGMNAEDRALEEIANP